MAANLELLNRVRAKWAEDIDAASAWSDDLASGVLKAYKTLQTGGRKGAGAAPDADVARAVWSSEEGARKQRGMAANVFQMVSGGREPSERDLDNLSAWTTIETLTEAAEALISGGGQEDAVAAAASTRGPEVDWAWCDAFAAEYGRDPLVAEYVHLRSGDRDRTLTELAAAHSAAYAELRDVHSGYLDSELTEAAFARLYVPAAYDDAAAVASEAVRRVTDSAEYGDAMRARLSHLHELLFDVPLADADAGYLFEDRVRAERLPLNTDRLNGLVTAFRDEADAHAADVCEAYASLLGRQPTGREARAQTGAYRVDAKTARRELLDKLAHGLEFADVVRRAVLGVTPDAPAAQVFAVVARTVAAFPRTLQERETEPIDGQQQVATLSALLKAEIKAAAAAEDADSD